jgi:hypothetical protein
MIQQRLGTVTVQEPETNVESHGVPGTLSREGDASRSNDSTLNNLKTIHHLGENASI